MIGQLIVVLTLMANLMEAQAYNEINTFAGVQSVFGTSSGNGGPATSARFDTPYGTWVDTVGVAFQCEKFRIRKISSSGIINAFFGTGVIDIGGNGGAATAATGNPMSVWGDSVGSIYFSNSGGVFRKISSNSIVNSFAGGGTLTDENVAATQASFGSVYSVFGDTLGNMYTLCEPDNKIKKIATSTLLVTTFAGTGSGDKTDTSTVAGDGGKATAARLFYPMGGYLDSSSNMYFTSYGGGYIRKISLATSIVTLVAGGSGTQGYSGDMGPATNALLPYTPSVVAADSAGTVYYGASNYNNLRYVDTNGIIGPYAGVPGIGNNVGYSGDGGAATAALMNYPHRITVRGNLVYVNEKNNHFVRSITAASDPVSIEFAGYTTQQPSIVPSKSPSNIPTVKPTAVPTDTAGPTVAPTTIAPTTVPTTTTPSITPSRTPSVIPTVKPSSIPSVIPSVGPSKVPTVLPTRAPTVVPTSSSAAPSVIPTCTPSVIPTVLPTTTLPSIVPTVIPSTTPTTIQPTMSPSNLPSVSPTLVPTILPSIMPTIVPTVTPSALPTVVPSMVPTEIPTVSPTELPTVQPTVLPSNSPSVDPTVVPTVVPTIKPTGDPTLMPSMPPTVAPSDAPSVKPSFTPSMCPSVRPTAPTKAPTKLPTVRPTRTVLTVTPTLSPSVAPTAAPTEAIAISFDSDIYLHNVTATVLGVTEQSAVAGAVAETLSLNSDQVTFLSQELIGVDGQPQQRLRRLTDGDFLSYQILVSVNVWASTRDFEDTTNQNASYLYNRLITTLTTAVASNAFTATVRSVSAEMNALNTLYVGHVSVNMTDYIVVTVSAPSDHQNHHNLLSTSEFAGIVIGVLMSAVLVIAGCYYCNLWRSEAAQAVSALPTNTLKL